MLNRLRNYVLSLMGGSKRTITIKKNIIASFIIKGFSIFVSFLMVPIVLGYLDKEKYGIWLTLTTFFTWFSFFDIGLGNGLRNNLAESIARRKFKLAKIYVSTTYFILLLIMGSVMVLFSLINPHLHWSRILNASSGIENELSIVALIVFNLFFIQFILKLINTILYAVQKPAMSNALAPTSSFISLLIIFLLTKTTKGSLLYLGIALNVTPIIVLLAASLIYFSKQLRFIRPSLQYVRLKFAGPLFNLGISFFIINICHIIKYQTSNLIIAQFFGPAEVTPYSIAYKYFTIPHMAFSIILTPFWSAFTDAQAINDIKWIKNSIHKIVVLWRWVVALIIIMLLGSNYFYRFWVGKEIVIPISLSAAMALYFMLFSFGGIYSIYINGVGKIRLQIISSIVGAIIFFPLAYLFINVIHWGTVGLVFAIILTNFYGPLLGPIQYRKIINNNARSIWAK
ncbi:MAG: hypothetical protein JW973_05855 [Bacteroidales bacterium]|nr:hypothetical protein [Bacteroidales bacterium]